MENEGGTSGPTILWDEMKENAMGAANNIDGGARKFLKLLSDKIGNDRPALFSAILLCSSFLFEFVRQLVFLFKFVRSVKKIM